MSTSRTAKVYFSVNATVYLCEVILFRLLKGVWSNTIFFCTAWELIKNVFFIIMRRCLQKSLILNCSWINNLVIEHFECYVKIQFCLPFCTFLLPISLKGIGYLSLYTSHGCNEYLKGQWFVASGPGY